MAAFAGAGGTVKVGASPTDIGELRSWALTVTPRPQATRVLSSEWDTFLDGAVVPKGWEGTATAWWDAADAGQLELTEGDKVAIDFQPAGEGSGSTTYKGDAIVTGIARSAEDEGVVEVEFTFLGTGPLTTTVVP